ncbi:Acyl-coenzyme A thioesterase THEM4 isoform A [Micractinium conductrix]|uniref:Acyl-coenzyme A thioesterase THEM4 isoform A n=1 Tax=Micractinium conductrix TaxID=554055 RepID=A0A2P6V256_9CHLO|nr:Acyl-coenzyme A thioesterase THEM4 isoform A [Micractinium conductrix]|eukprot:PSC68178.1 Acyl-coenzyme A thioesterase THEM4 isoform A [Micractinium conductrix]
MPGTVPAAASSGQQRPLSQIDRIKSQKALAAANGSGGVAAHGGETYMRGARGQAEDLDRLVKLDWTKELLAQPDMQTLLTCGAMSKAPEPGDDGVNGVDPDHLFLSLLRQDLIRDLLFLYNPTERTFRTLMSVGMDVCGHPTIVHGGFTSAMIDETTGGLVYELKKAGELGEGSAFTARLEVDYKRPMPSNSDVVCTARVEKVEGRKIWTVAEVADRPGGTVYALVRSSMAFMGGSIESGLLGSRSGTPSGTPRDSAALRFHSWLPGAALAVALLLTAGLLGMRTAPVEPGLRLREAHLDTVTGLESPGDACPPPRPCPPQKACPPCAAAAAGAAQQRQKQRQQRERAGQPQRVLDAWVQRLTVPWGPLLTEQEAQRGLSYYGSGERLQAVAAKLMAGKPIKVFTLGASVTRGIGTTDRRYSYASRLFEWIQAAFPHKDHVFVNRGIGGTSSAIYSVCAEHMVQEDADLIVLEFSANDLKDAPFSHPERKGYEQLVRKLLGMWGRPALIQLHHYAWWHAVGDGVEDGGLFYHPAAEAQLGVFAQYYDFPSVSVRGAMWHLMRSRVGQFNPDAARHGATASPTDYPIPGAEPGTEKQYWYRDRTHPGDEGHGMLAELLAHVLAKAVMESLSPRPRLHLAGRDADLAPARDARGLPLPMIPGNAATPTTLCAIEEDFQDVVDASKGFAYKPERPDGRNFVEQKWGWSAAKPGAWAEMLFDSASGFVDLTGNATNEGAQVSLSYLKSYKGMGTAELACVSGCTCEPQALDGTWETELSLQQILQFWVSRHRRCRVRITVSERPGAVAQRGHKVQLLGIMVSHFSVRLTTYPDQKESDPRLVARAPGFACTTLLFALALVGSATYLATCQRGGLSLCPAWTSLRPAAAPRCGVPQSHPQVINGGRLFLPGDALRRGTTAYGSGQRMERLGAKLLAGQPVTVTFLGGSITWGRGGNEGGSFVVRFTEWLNSTWPHPGHRIINHGLPAVTSALFAACYDNVPKDSDLVVLDFAVNDAAVSPNGRDKLGYSFSNGQRRGFEQLVRKSLKLRDEPAVVLLQFFSWNATRDKTEGKVVNGMPTGSQPYGDSFFWRTIEDELSTVAAYYDAPVMSLRNAAYHLLREQQHGFQWNVSLHHLVDSDAPEAEIERQKDAQFFWDENHPWDRTGHRAMAELLMATVSRGVQAAADAHLAHAACAGGHAGVPLALPPLPPLPPPMVTGNYEANATSCHLQEAFENVIQEEGGFKYEARAPDEDTFVAQKWGLTASKPGASATLRVDTELGGLSGKMDAVQVHLLFLRSWRGMGRALVECEGGCECEATELEGHWERQATLTDLYTLQVSPHPRCQLRVTVQEGSASGEHMFSVSGVVVSSVDARMERGKIGQWEYNKART